MILAVYAGTFDPVTKGHIDIVERAAAMFDRLVVGVFDTPSKTVLFSTEERMRFLQRTVQKSSNVEVRSYGGLTVDFAHELGATAMVRGLRSITDLDYEAAMVMMNRRLRPNIDTIFLYTSLEYQFVSSSLIKEVARYGGDIKDLVPQHVAAALKEKYLIAQ
ncbi:MAG: pantetheine-phosphate adenylyltransferase [Dehalococcoidia bacterium]|nr:pantetheine-phosphate adenylyltransferase [Dehalococcoidia bacterium]